MRVPNPASPAIKDHTVLPAMCNPIQVNIEQASLNASQTGGTPEGWKAELTWVLVYYMLCLCVGLLATVAVLANGIWQMRSGNQAKSQRMMRLRVFAQGFTVAALLGGVMMSTRMKKE